MIHSQRVIRRSAWLALVAASTAHGSSEAQNRGQARVFGFVVSAGDRQPVGGARMRLVGTSFRLVTDSTGAFLFKDLLEGSYTLEAVVAGVDSATTTFDLGKRDRVEIEFAVGAKLGMVLPDLEVEVDANASSGRLEFERRRSQGPGRYLTREFIESRNPSNLMDLMRSVPGAQIECGRGRDCIVRFSRNPRGCSPGYFMDGMPADPSVLFLTVPNEVAGIEVYTGPAETPAELEGASARCGIIAIWTRLGRRNGRP